MAVRARACLRSGGLVPYPRSYCQAHERATAGTGKRGSTRPWRRLRQAVLTRDGDRCRYCGAPATAVHHLIPKTNGGRDDLTNLVAVCDRCHAQRHGH